MTTIKKQIELLGENGNKVIGYAIIDSMLNIIYEVLEEMEDDDISNAIRDLQLLVIHNEDKFLNTEID